MFSFVFGDGDPNEGFEQRRWQAVGDTLRRLGGSVTAEQLAPLLEPPPPGPGRERGAALLPEQEGFVLPALTRFEGSPEVSADGSILYVFPALQATAGRPAKGGKAAKGGQVAPLQESKWAFSNASEAQKLLVVLFGAFNAFGVAVLSRLVRLRRGSASAG